MSRNAKFERALPSDAPALLELIESVPAKGSIELLYTRRPNPLLSYIKEAGGDAADVSVGVLRDADGKPWFMEVNVLREYFFDGEPVRVGYLGGVKKREGVSIKRNWLLGIFDFEVGPASSASGFYFSVLAANKRGVKLFSKRRSYMPAVYHICDFSTFLINPKVLVYRKLTCNCSVDYSKEKDEINEFINGFGKDFNLFPVIKDITTQLSGVHSEDMFALRRDGEIVAFAALWDQSEYRQNIISGYHGAMRIASHLSGISNLLGYIPFPKEGETAKFAVIGLVCIKNQDQDLLKQLLSNIAKTARERGYKTIVHGIPKESWQFPLLEKTKKIGFDSKLYFTRPETTEYEIQLNTKPPHFEVGWL
jgi:hypothetical protein